MLSSEEEDFQPHVRLPHINLAGHRKQSPKTNLARASKKIAGGKLVRFPDLYTPTEGPLLTNESLLDLDASNVDPTLPSFRMPQQPHKEAFSEEENESETAHHPVSYETDLLDDGHGETDITDQLKKNGLLLLLLSQDKGNNFKDILRRIALTDQAYSEPEYGPSRSDTFLGRVLSLSGGPGSSGTGGMAPGASKMGDVLEDEETAVGNEIEMKRLDFSQVNDEAQKLILMHAPEAHAALQAQKEGETAPPTAPSEANSEENSPDRFYQPTSDFDLRDEVHNDYDDDEYLMLDGGGDGSYVAPPRQVHAGVLSSLLRLYQNPQEAKSLASMLLGRTTLAEENEQPSSSMADLGKWRLGLKKGPRALAGVLPGRKAHLAPQSSDSETYGDKDVDPSLPSFLNAKPKAPKKGHIAPKIPTKIPTNVPLKISAKIKKNKKHAEQQLRITVHITDILQRQRFIMRMCRALMLFGAPTHRLEEYMTMTSRVLEIDGQFIYFPGCMIVSFGDAATRTSEVHLVRCTQGLNLSKLSDTHKIYKNVIHDLVGVEEASVKLEELLRRKNQYLPWICVLLYGLGLALVTPFAFLGGWLDIPISFGVGLCVGYLQFFVLSISNLYSSVFEVSASIVVSFIARGIGTINGGNTFCFAAIAQGLLALILPGYIILCGSLELQSKNLVAGSVRMFYAIIYSLFLGFGITLGAALYGWVDKRSTSQTDCNVGHNIDDKWRILFVPLFSVCLGLINQARWSQIPVMIVILSVGYIGTYFAGKHFASVTEFTAAIGAFIIGILGNMYSRIWKGMAVSAMLPAIFVQVPSGIASKSTILLGIQSADNITHGGLGTSLSSVDSGSLSFGVTMVEVSIGISVGLFAAALVVYPFGKKRTGLFTL